MVVKVDLRNASKVTGKKLGGGKRKRFDYDAIKEELVAAGKRGEGFTFSEIGTIMAKHSSDPSRPVYGPQIRTCILRLARDPSVDVYKIDGERPVYVFVPAEESKEDNKAE